MVFPARATADSLSNAAHLADVQGLSLWKDARIRFFRNKAAVASLFVLIAVVLFAFFGGFFAAWSNKEIDWTVIGTGAAVNERPSLASGRYFGLDQDTRDLFARTVQGTRMSLLVGLVGSAVAVVGGTLYGAAADYIGGRTDQVMMRIVEVMMSILFMFVLILLLVVFGRSIIMIFVGIGLISWLDMARIARRQTLSIKNKEFVEAAVAIGVRPMKLVLRHIVPNLLGIVIVYATLLIRGMIITESFISFLGLGVQEPTTSLGALISRGAGQMTYGTLGMLTYPLFFLITMLYAFFFLGDGLRDALDPKNR